MTDLAPSVERVDPATLTPHPDNPRVGNLEAIKRSIEANGWWGVVVVQRSTGYVIVGNHRSRAAAELGLTEVPVQYVDVDDARAKAIMLADNRAADLAISDDEQLLRILRELDASDLLDGSLYSDADLDLLARVFDADDEATRRTLDEFAAPGAPPEAMTPGERAASYAASEIRSIILPLPLADYDFAVERLGELRAELEVDSNVAVILHLLRHS